MKVITRYEDISVDANIWFICDPKIVNMKCGSPEYDKYISEQAEKASKCSFDYVCVNGTFYACHEFCSVADIPENSRVLIMQEPSDITVSVSENVSDSCSPCELSCSDSNSKEFSKRLPSFDYIVDRNVALKVS